ncbi:MAG: YtxH domain-containing protein [Fimbriimonadaceae bacterium]|nr:YtxH domain-containing protein [Fimbriimonadaceae bacterium]
MVVIGSLVGILTGGVSGTLAGLLAPPEPQPFPVVPCSAGQERCF